MPTIWTPTKPDDTSRGLYDTLLESPEGRAALGIDATSADPSKNPNASGGFNNMTQAQRDWNVQYQEWARKMEEQRQAESGNTTLGSFLGDAMSQPAMQLALAALTAGTSGFDPSSFFSGAVADVGGGVDMFGNVLGGGNFTGGSIAASDGLGGSGLTDLGGGISGATQSFVAPEIVPQFAGTSTVASPSITQQFATQIQGVMPSLSASEANQVASTLMKAGLNSAKAALMGQDPLKAFVAGAAAGVLPQVLSQFGITGAGGLDSALANPALKGALIGGITTAIQGGNPLTGALAGGAGTAANTLLGGGLLGATAGGAVSGGIGSGSLQGALMGGLTGAGSNIGSGVLNNALGSNVTSSGGSFVAPQNNQFLGESTTDTALGLDPITTGETSNPFTTNPSFEDLMGTNGTDNSGIQPGLYNSTYTGSYGMGDNGATGPGADNTDVSGYTGAATDAVAGGPNSGGGNMSWLDNLFNAADGTVSGNSDGLDTAITNFGNTGTLDLSQLGSGFPGDPSNPAPDPTSGIGSGFPGDPGNTGTPPNSLESSGLGTNATIPGAGGTVTGALGTGNAAGGNSSAGTGSGAQTGGTGTGLGNSNLYGPLLGGLFSYLGQKSQADAYSNIANQLRADRAPALGAFNSALSNPDTFYNSAPAQGALSGALSKLSITGNPAASGTGLAKAAAYNLGGYNDYLSRLAAPAFGTVGAETGANTAAAGLSGAGYGAAGNALSSVLNPGISQQQMYQLMQQLSGAPT